MNSQGLNVAVSSVGSQWKERLRTKEENAKVFSRGERDLKIFEREGISGNF